MSQDLSFLSRLDPWETSSLLQKAIRRSEARLACHAASQLYRYRGKGVWKRLVTIAFEDVGIANSDLLLEAALLASDESARVVLGSDQELIAGLVERMAASPKDRSADYLVCAMLKLPEGRDALSGLAVVPHAELLVICRDDTQPLIMRGAAIWQTLTPRRPGAMLKRSKALDDFLAGLAGLSDMRLLDAVDLAAKRGIDPFVLMIPILSAALQRSGAATVREHIVPASLSDKGAPLYVFDKHTSTGKRAINRFASRCSGFRERLEEHSTSADHAPLAQMAAFYADAIPVARQLVWEHSEALYHLGMKADMMSAGCTEDGVAKLVEAACHHLPDLDDQRRAVLAGRGL